MSAYMTPATFKSHYTAFSELSDARVQFALDDAAAMVDAKTYGARLRLAHGLQTAHLLAISPDGEDLRLVNKDGSTVWEKQLMKVRSASVVTFLAT